MSATTPQPPSRWKLALLSPWTGIVAGLSAATALLLREPWPLLAGAALSTAWVVLASRPGASEKLFGKHHEAAAVAVRAARRAQLVQSLPEDDRARVGRLDERRRDILKQAGDNQHFSGELLQVELDKLDEIVDSFVELATSCARWSGHLAAVDFDDLESETRRYESDAARAVDEDQRSLAKQNLALLGKRRDQLGEMRKKAQNGRAQLDLIESSFRLIANEIMLMRSTKELGGQLDDILVGVGAVREMTRDEDELLRGGRAQAASTAAAQSQRQRGS